MSHSLRVAAALSLAVAAVAVFAVSASASAPHVTHAQATITDAVFPDAYLTTACGFEVNDTLNAFTTATGVVAANGEVVSEFDTWSGTFTFTATGSGKSVTRPLKALVFTKYGSGAVVGSTGVSTSVGNRVERCSAARPGPAPIRRTSRWSASTRRPAFPSPRRRPRSRPMATSGSLRERSARR